MMMMHFFYPTYQFESNHDCFTHYLLLSSQTATDRLLSAALAATSNPMVVAERLRTTTSTALG